MSATVIDFRAARERLRPGSKRFDGVKDSVAVAPEGHYVEVTQAGGLVVVAIRHQGLRMLECHWAPESAEEVATKLNRFAFAARKDRVRE